VTRDRAAEGRATAASPHPLPVHVREIRIDAVETLASGDTPASLRVHGVLEDRRPRNMPDWIQHDGDVIHHMAVTLTVAWPELVITEIEGTMRTFPHPGVCPDAVPPLQSLVGVTVGRGFTRAVNERIGRERGCTHVTALILAMGPIVRQGAGAAFGFVKPGSGAMPWFINSCQAWREGGPLHRTFLPGSAEEVSRNG
jgi:hypothetical protein